MSLDIRDRVAIVTGGSAGIGYAIAMVLAQNGAHVIVTARRGDALEQAAKNLSSVTGRAVMALTSDTTDQKQVDRVVDAALAKYSRVDILINCAASPGGLVRNQIEELDSAALLQDLNTKVVGYARCCKAVVPSMKRQRWGRIVNIGGLTGRSSNTLSGMRNAAVTHLTKSLSDQLGPDGITVNCIHPGIVRTPHLNELIDAEAKKRSGSPQEVEREFVAETPIRRILEVEEIAEVVAFLTSSGAAAITGESIAVDGGITRGIYL